MSARFETRLGLGLLGCLKRRDVARGHRYHRHRRRDMKYIVFLGARVPCGASARNTLNASLKFLLVLELSRSKCQCRMCLRLAVAFAHGLVLVVLLLLLLLVLLTTFKPALTLQCTFRLWLAHF